MALLDHLFLHVLREDTHRAAELFTQLFANAPTPAVLRFLSDRPSVLDVLHVVAGLPAGPFVKKLASMCIGRASALRESFVS
jgi:lycopene beta-cyclase